MIFAIIPAAALIGSIGILGMLALAQKLADKIADRREMAVPDRRDDHEWLRDMLSPMTYLPWIRRHLRRHGGTR